MDRSKKALAAFRRSLVARYFLRFHMSLLLASTAATGFGASKLLLLIGLTDVRLRYPLALLVAYGGFLILVRLWISYVTSIRLPVPDLSLDLPGLGDSGGAAPDFDAPAAVEFGGGDFGGGGASASWADLTPPEVNLPKIDLPDVDVPDIDLDIGGDDAIWLVLVLVIVVGIVCGASVWMIWMAPELLADVACSALLAASLRGKTLELERSSWAGRVFGRTWIPLFLTLLAVIALGFAVHSVCPAATRLVEAFACPVTQ